MLSAHGNGMPSSTAANSCSMDEDAQPAEPSSRKKGMDCAFSKEEVAWSITRCDR